MTGKVTSNFLLKKKITKHSSTIYPKLDNLDNATACAYYVQMVSNISALPKPVNGLPPSKITAEWNVDCKTTKSIVKSTSTKMMTNIRTIYPKINGNSEIDQMKPHNKGQTISWRRIPECLFTKECYNCNKELLEHFIIVKRDCCYISSAFCQICWHDKIAIRSEEKAW